MTRRFSLLAAVIALGMTGSLQAAITTESSTFTNVPIASPAFLITLNKFNPALGTLTSVEFKLEVTTSGSSLSFDNEATVAGTVTLNLGAQVKATTGSPLTTVAMVNPATSGTGSVTADDDGLSDFAGLDSFGISSGVLSDSDSVLRTTAPYLAQFTAAGMDTTFDTSITNTRSDSYSTSGIFGNTSSQGGIFSGKLSVIYTYDPLPIPEGSSALFGACLGGMAGVRRLRLRKR